MRDEIDTAWSSILSTTISSEHPIAEKPEVQARVLESMAEGVVLTDDDGIISYTNPAFEKMFGYEPGELNGRHVFILNGGSQPEHEQQFLEITRHLERNDVWSGEYFNRRKDGAFFYTQAHISTLELSGHRYFISVQEDITERKRMEEELLQQRTILEKRVAERTDQLEKHRLELEAKTRSCWKPITNSKFPATVIRTSTISPRSVMSPLTTRGLSGTST